MSGNIVRSAIFLLLLGSQADEWEPIIRGDTIGRMAVLAESPATNAAPAIGREMWFSAATGAYVPLVREYLNERIIFGELPANLDAVRWWSLTLENDPAVVVAAISNAETEYITWDIRQWPEPLNSTKPAYRLALVEAMFESYMASITRADTLRAEIAAFKPVNQFAPAGPPSAMPADIKDPELRAEYQARLNEIQHQKTVEAELRRTVNATGVLSHGAGERIKLLYQGADPDEVQRLAELIVDGNWSGNELYRKIIDDWPGLDRVVADAQREP